MISKARRTISLVRTTSALPVRTILCLTPLLGGLTGCSSPETKVSGDTKIEQLNADGITSAMTRIARLEDARTTGQGELTRYIRHGDTGVRRRAAQALGRLSAKHFRSEVTSALATALADEDAGVRREAAYAIGQRGDVDAAEALLEHWQDEDDLVRAAIVEAASRLPLARLREEILFSVGDPAEVVRREVVVAPHRWIGDAGRSDLGPTGEQIDTVLIVVTRKLPLVDGQRAPLPGVEYDDAHTESDEVIWHALFTLARRKSARARDSFLRHARSKESRLSRLYAIRGLAAIAGAEGIGPDDVELRGALEHALSDSDWRIACEALVGLGNHKAPTSLSKLADAFRHDSAHVRRVSYEVLGKLPVDPVEAEAWVERGSQDRSVAVRAASLLARAEIYGAEAMEAISSRSDNPHHVLRTGVCVAAGIVGGDEATKLLFAMTKDPHMAVSGAAIAALGALAKASSEEPEEVKRAEGVHDSIRELLDLEDNGLRAAAVAALQNSIKAGDLSYLSDVYANATGDGGSELRNACLESVKGILTPEATALLEFGLSDEHIYVRDTARKLLSERDPERSFEEEVEAADLPEVPVTASTEMDVIDNPIVEIVTTRGVMVFELFPREAPLHVYNFLELARRGHYDELDFHRVVPDFVIQGGCYRGDGNGSITWREGEALRQEFGTRKYVRGSLGMPRNSDPESGGSQIFVNHRATPHLDGRYTIFGELREGLDVLDTVEVGDKILTVDIRS
ncbi:MAG: peptidyl-prolyl cis-trans isomerase B (cyclophilin B) [Planctomycetota bacterium]|jgi:peptidyl-prolyl cis-trans isomerase B (cyclophilin B)